MFSHLNLLSIVIVVGVLIVSMTIHEMMHAFTGFWLGDDTAAEQGRISFNPLRHIDPLLTIVLPVVTLLVFQVPILAAKPVPFNPERIKWDEFGAALIALAGPLSNLVLALVAALIIRVAHPLGIPYEIAYTALLLNVSLFVFNLIPIPPLDGSRVLYAFSPDPLRDILASLEGYGMFIIIALVVMGGFGGFLGHLNQMVLNILL